MWQIFFNLFLIFNHFSGVHRLYEYGKKLFEIKIFKNKSLKKI